MVYTHRKMIAYCELEISNCHSVTPQLVSIHVQCAYHYVVIRKFTSIYDIQSSVI